VSDPIKFSAGSLPGPRRKGQNTTISDKYHASFWSLRCTAFHDTGQQYVNLGYSVVAKF